MSERGKKIEALLRAAGLEPLLVGIDAKDDGVWAKFKMRDGSSPTLAVSPYVDSDEFAAMDIIRQADEIGVPRNASTRLRTD